MPLPTPEPGLVLSYDFLWAEDAERGLIEGQKARPCIIVSVKRHAGTGNIWVAVVPVTHSPPTEPDYAIEVPQILKSHLGLDAERSWAVVTEVNYFEWPGHDLRQVPGKPGQFVYGQLPPGFYRSLIERVRHAISRSVTTLRR